MQGQRQVWRQSGRREHKGSQAESYRHEGKRTQRRRCFVRDLKISHGAVEKNNSELDWTGRTTGSRAGSAGLRHVGLGARYGNAKAMTWSPGLSSLTLGSSCTKQSKPSTFHAPFYTTPSPSKPILSEPTLCSSFDLVPLAGPLCVVRHTCVLHMCSWP